MFDRKWGVIHVWLVEFGKRFTFCILQENNAVLLIKYLCGLRKKGLLIYKTECNNIAGFLNNENFVRISVKTWIRASTGPWSIPPTHRCQARYRGNLRLVSAQLCWVLVLCVSCLSVFSTRTVDRSRCVLRGVSVVRPFNVVHSAGVRFSQGSRVITVRRDGGHG